MQQIDDSIFDLIDFDALADVGDLVFVRSWYAHYVYGLITRVFVPNSVLVHAPTYVTYVDLTSFQRCTARLNDVIVIERFCDPLEVTS